MNINPTNHSLSVTNSSSSPAAKISSGKQINSAADGPATLQILEQYNSHIRGNNVAYTNVISGTSALQIAAGGLSNISDSLQQLRELGIQAANGVLNSSDRNTIQKQADELIEGIKDTLNSSQFNNRSLLNNDTAITIQSGANKGQTQTIPSFNLAADFSDVGLFDIDFSSGNISDTLASIDSAMDINDAASSAVGIAENGLERVAKSLIGSTVSQASSRSQIEDTDFAAVVSELKQQQLHEQVELAMLSQAHANRSQVLQLLK